MRAPLHRPSPHTPNKTSPQPAVPPGTRRSAPRGRRHTRHKTSRVQDYRRRTLNISPLRPFRASSAQTQIPDHPHFASMRKYKLRKTLPSNQPQVPQCHFPHRLQRRRRAANCPRKRGKIAAVSSLPLFTGKSLRSACCRRGWGFVNVPPPQHLPRTALLLLCINQIKRRLKSLAAVNGLCP